MSDAESSQLLTDRLTDYLRDAHDSITYAEPALKLFRLIKTILEKFQGAQREHAPTFSDIDIVDAKMCMLGGCLRVDMMRHITALNTRTPLYFNRLTDWLVKANQNSIPNSPVEAEWIISLSTELNLLFDEYGFLSLSALESCTDVDGANLKIGQLCQRLSSIEKSLEGPNSNQSFAIMSELKKVVAGYAALYVYGDSNVAARIKPQMIALDTKIRTTEMAMMEKHLKLESELSVRYLAMFEVLRKGCGKSLFYADASDVINSRVVHPLSRSWLFERIDRWLHSPQSKRLFFVFSKQGFGRTAIASTVCKRYEDGIIARYFFDADRGAESPHNHITGLVQSIAANMMRSVPEYLNYIDKAGGTEGYVMKLGTTWRDDYNMLIRDPLKALYGKVKPDDTKERRKLIVLDSLDECGVEEWKDVTAFLTEFIKDTPSMFCFFVTIRSKHSGTILPRLDYGLLEGVRLDDRAWISQHIGDVEVYLSASLGVILSSGNAGSSRSSGPVNSSSSPSHGRVDQKTLEHALDDLVKTTAGRFDWAVELMELLAREMSTGGNQFLTSLNKATSSFRQLHGTEEPTSDRGHSATIKSPTGSGAFERRRGDFASAFSSHRDKSGRTVSVDVDSAHSHHMNRSRLPLLLKR